MKSRLLWLAILAVLAAVAVSFFVPRPLRPSPAIRNAVPPVALRELAPPPLPAITVPPPNFPTVAPAVIPAPRPKIFQSPPLEIPIQDHATIDFSLGAPMVRSGGTDGAALEQALKNMDDATKNMKFGPGTTPTPNPPPAPANAPQK
jgi:hypothetical protein